MSEPAFRSKPFMKHAPVEQSDLFGGTSSLPEGFTYRPEFITAEEERQLLAIVSNLPLEEAKYKEYTAKRRTVSYGSQYDFTDNQLHETSAIPEFLMPLRKRVACWTAAPADDFVQALVSEYRAGTQLGWHRDVPEFDIIVGVSLGAECRMRLRPYRPHGKNDRSDVIVLEVAPRSAYVIRGAARWQWQHSIAPTREERYSITLRTMRRMPGRRDVANR